MSSTQEPWGAGTRDTLGGDGQQAAWQWARDAEHLKVLSICWYVAAGLAFLFGMCPGFYLGLGVFMYVAPQEFDHPPAQVPWIVMIVGIVGIALVWTWAILALLTGRSLALRRRMLLCYITAGLACLNIPLGLILAIFTFIVLGRPSVREQFRQGVT